MNYAPGRSAAGPMILIAIAVRIYWGIAADHSNVPNAAWMCPLIALILFLPFCLAEGRMRALGNSSPWANLSARIPKPLKWLAEAAFVLLLIYDCALSMRLMAYSANLLALGEVAIILLLFPLAILLAAAVLIGPDALGSCARLWLRIVPLLLAVVFIVQVQVYNPAWLTPILGGGIANIADGGLYCGGCIALLFLPWLTAVPDRCKQSPLIYIAIPAIVAAAMLACTQMLCPPIEGMELSRIGRIKLILSNGRAALSLQMLLVVLWYGALLQLMSVEAVTAATFLNSMIPKAPRWSLAAGEALLAIIAASSSITAQNYSSMLFGWVYAAIAGILAILMICACLKKGEKPCAV